MSSTANQPWARKFCEWLEYPLENAFSGLGSQFSGDSDEADQHSAVMPINVPG